MKKVYYLLFLFLSSFISLNQTNANLEYSSSPDLVTCWNIFWTSFNFRDGQNSFVFSDDWTRLYFSTDDNGLYTRNYFLKYVDLTLPFSCLNTTWNIQTIASQTNYSFSDLNINWNILYYKSNNLIKKINLSTLSISTLYTNTTWNLLYLYLDKYSQNIYIKRNVSGSDWEFLQYDLQNDSFIYNFTLNDFIYNSINYTNTNSNGYFFYNDIVYFVYIASTNTWIYKYNINWDYIDTFSIPANWLSWTNQNNYFRSARVIKDFLQLRWVNFLTQTSATLVNYNIENNLYNPVEPVALMWTPVDLENGVIYNIWNIYDNVTNENLIWDLYFEVTPLTWTGETLTTDYYNYDFDYSQKITFPYFPYFWDYEIKAKFLYNWDTFDLFTDNINITLPESYYVPIQPIQCSLLDIWCWITWFANEIYNWFQNFFKTIINSIYNDIISAISVITDNTFYQVIEGFFFFTPDNDVILPVPWLNNNWQIYLDTITATRWTNSWPDLIPFFDINPDENWYDIISFIIAFWLFIFRLLMILLLLSPLAIIVNIYEYIANILQVQKSNNGNVFTLFSYFAYISTFLVTFAFIWTFMLAFSEILLISINYIEFFVFSFTDFIGITDNIYIYYNLFLFSFTFLLIYIVYNITNKYGKLN